MNNYYTAKQTKKHYWTFEEDKTCCKIFIKNYIQNNYNYTINDSIMEILNIHPNLKTSSVRMKLQNIAQICKEYKLPNSFPVKELENYSPQNLQAMNEAWKELNVNLK